MGSRSFRFYFGPLVLIAIVAGMLYAIYGLDGDDGSAEGTVPLSGSVSLTGGAFTAQDNGGCANTAGYDDIVAGAPVTVQDGAGKVIGVGGLAPGVPADFFQHEGKQIAAACRFAFRISVPATDFYGIQVSHRGKITYSRAQATSGGISMQLG